MKKYRWGIIAPGSIAGKFAESLQTISDALLYAVGSREKSRAETFAQKYGCEKIYGSYREAAEDPLTDIVYVATPHPQHEEAAIMCLENGKAVLCEKPFAVNARQAERMIQSARKNNVFLMEAMWTRFLPAICKVRELLAEGAIGKVNLVCADFGFCADVDPQSRLFSPALAGGSLLDVGIYNLSFCSMVFGKQPSNIQSHMVIGSTGVDEECSVGFMYDKGQNAILHSAIRLLTPHIATISGRKGRIEIPDFWRAQSFKLYKGDQVQEYNLPYESFGFQFEALEVQRCLNEGLKESPVMPLEETLAILQTADFIRRENGLCYPCD